MRFINVTVNNNNNNNNKIIIFIIILRYGKITLHVLKKRINCDRSIIHDKYSHYLKVSLKDSFENWRKKYKNKLFELSDFYSFDLIWYVNLNFEEQRNDGLFRL